MKSVAVIGIGMVGRELFKVLEERQFNIGNLFIFASSRSAGKNVEFGGKTYVVEELTESSFDRGIDIAFFAAGGDVSKKYASIAASKNCVVIDNSSAWRMNEDVPLVVPEVNSGDLARHKGIIANPNCSTIQAVTALYPLHKKYGIKRIVYSTYQSVSGAQLSGYQDLEDGLKGLPPKKFLHPIAGNCIPHIDVFLENGYTKEEEKMIFETRKIMNAPEIKITATAVRVPVFYGHCESINVEFNNPYELGELIGILERAPGVVVQNNHGENQYPMPIYAAGTDEVYVGRIRRDFSVENGVNLWVVSDNTRKGAATNAIQIAEALLGQGRGL